MKRLLLLAILAASGQALAQPSPFAGALAGLTAERAPAGLLLGLAGEQGYRTLYLTWDAGQVTLARDLPFLVSPQRDGWWLLGPIAAGAGKGCAQDDCPFTVREIWIGRDRGAEAAMRASLESELAGIQAEAAAAGGFGEAEIHFEREINYVAAGVVCVDDIGYTYMGGAHPSHVDAEQCLPLAAQLDPTAPASLADFMTPTALEPVVARLQAEVAAARFEEAEVPRDFLADLGQANYQALPFRLGRKGGTTQVTALAQVDAPYALSGTYRLTAAAAAGPAPERLAPYNPPLPFFGQLLAVDPAVEDAFLSPLHNVLFVLTRDALVGIDVASNREVFSMDMPHDRVVMAEWALRDHAARWAAEIARVSE